MRVGVLGVGRMGLPIAVRLAETGFEVRVFDVAAERISAALAAGLTAARSGSELALASDVLVTVLPGAAEAREVLLVGGLDGGGLLDQLEPGSLWLDLTSNDPTVVEAAAQLAATRGVASVSAPMGGGASAAEAASIRFYVGGAAESVERARPILESLGGVDAVDHIGTAIGDGCTAKLLANLLWFGQVVAVTEALLLGVSLGVPVATLRRTLASSAGGSVFIDEYLDSLLAGDYLESFGISRCVEELEILVRLAERADVPFELSSHVARLHREALDRFGAIDGEMLAAKLLEQRAGTTLRLS